VSHELYDVGRYRFWFQRFVRDGPITHLGHRVHPVFGGSRLECGFVVLAFALLPWTLGLAATAVVGNAGLYLRTPAFYLGVVGVALVMWSMTRGIERLCTNLKELEAATVDVPRYYATVDDALRRAADRRSTAAVVCAFLLVLLSVIVVAVHSWSTPGPVKTDRVVSFFPEGWRAPDVRVLAGVVSGLFALWIAAVLGTGLELLVRNVLFVRRLRRVEFVAFPAVLRMKLHPFVYTYLFISLTWTLGVGLWAFFFVGQYSAIRTVALAVLFALGVLTFAAPYAALRTILDRSHDTMSLRLSSRVAPAWQPDFAALDPREFTSVNTAIAADAPPVLRRRGALAYVVFQLVVVVSLVEKAFVQHLLHIGGG
jgi:hypothetical protein